MLFDGYWNRLGMLRCSTKPWDGRQIACKAFYYPTFRKTTILISLVLIWKFDRINIFIGNYQLNRFGM